MSICTTCGGRGSVVAPLANSYTTCPSCQGLGYDASFAAKMSVNPFIQQQPSRRARKKGPSNVLGILALLVLAFIIAQQF